MKHTILCFSILFLVIGNFTINAQNITVEGKVTSTVDKLALPGANITVKGTNIGATTNFDGEFSINVPNRSSTLVFSYQGFKTEEVIVGDQTFMDIALEEDISKLDEIVLIGYGSSKRKDLTGSISSIKATDLESVKATTADEFVQGRVSGLLLTQTSGQPGAATSVRIRGSSSINAGNEPLYVIDGFPVDNNSDNLSAGNVAEGPNLNALSTLSPSDIESIDVLKDASATAIYGSRGANGVIIITTKRGKNGKAQINYDTYVSVSEVNKKLDVLNASQFAHYINEANYNNGDPRFYTNPNAFGIGTNWQDEIFRTAYTINHDLSITGGNDDVKYAVSASYLNQDGTIIETNFKRYNFRVNLDFKASERLKITNSLSINRSDYNTARTNTNGGLGVSSAVTGAYLMNPMLPVFDSEGNYTLGNFGVENDGSFVNDIDNPFEQIQNFASPVAYQNLLDSKGRTTRILDNLSIDWDIAKNLKLKTNLGADFVVQEESLFRTAQLDFGNSRSAFASQAKRISNSFLAETTLNYTNTFNDIHSLNALLGTSIQDFKIEELGGNVLGLSTENFGANNFAFGETAATNNLIIESKLLSYFSRINYSLDGKYIFTATARVDGSSKFGDGYKFGFFPAGAFAWNVSEEDFMQNSDTYIKLRLGYGIIGNESIPAYSSKDRFGNTYHYFNNNLANGIYPFSPSNSNLKWERTQQYNLGLDFKFFNDRIGITTDVYRKDTNDLLLNLQVPTQTGYTNTLINVGSVRNEGIELALNTINVASENFKWDTNITVAYNKNEILDLAGLNEIPTGSSILGISSWQLLVEGGEIGAFYGYVSDGIMQLDDTPANTPLFATDGGVVTPGERKYKDLNGDGVIDADNDRTFLGNPIPEYTFGISNSFSYKSFDLNIFLQGVYGNEIANFNRINLEDFNGRNNVLLEAFSNRWTPENPSNVYPRAFRGVRNNVFADNYIEDGSYLRVKSVSLAYTLSNQFLSKLSINKLKIYITGKNLYTFTNYTGVDPEVSWGGQNNALSAGADFGGYPTSKTYLMGLNINF
ncbi:TonB-linked SusC/RagA family outer membrane protein [Flavobacteriaceae bacterium MAR_2010_72]|nr:TonB-linked SusC/RagA family outer membrane protein [Flavobacteriaceae bacterium MAR_2010_72]